jgi:hypothetical protein
MPKISVALIVVALSTQAALAAPQRSRGGASFQLTEGQTIHGWETLTAYMPDGTKILVRDQAPDGGTLVVVNGCLTCPRFLQSYFGAEAVAHDYRDDDTIRFLYLYKTLAHPENDGFVQPFTLEERRMQASLAAARLKTAIPFIVDGMDNAALQAFGSSPNSEVVVNSDGTILHAQRWCKGEDLRAALKTIVGDTDTVTSERALGLPPFKRVAASRGTVVPRARPTEPMMALRLEPADSDAPHYVKLRAEAGQRATSGGKAELLLGFHLDPVHDVHWNNLVDPILFAVTGPEGVSITPATGSGPKVDASIDHDPREFLLTINNWTGTEPLRVSVTYFACSDGDTKFCTKIQQAYLVYPERDRYAGMVQSRGRGQRGRGGPGAENRPDRAQMMERMDRNGDGALSRAEIEGTRMEQHFDRMDQNGDGILDKEELEAMRSRGSRGTTRRRSTDRPGAT